MSDVHKNVEVTVATNVEQNRVEIKIECPNCGIDRLSLSAAHLPVLAAILSQIVEEQGMRPVDGIDPVKTEVLTDAEARARLNTWKPH